MTVAWWVRPLATAVLLWRAIIDRGVPEWLVRFVRRHGLKEK